MSEARLESLGEGRFRLLGGLDYDSVPLLWERSLEAFEPHAGLQLDLQGVSRADSAAVALLLAWTRWAARRGRPIRFLRVPRSMLAIIELSDLEGLLPIEP